MQRILNGAIKIINLFITLRFKQNLFCGHFCTKENVLQSVEKSFTFSLASVNDVQVEVSPFLVLSICAVFVFHFCDLGKNFISLLLFQNKTNFNLVCTFCLTQ